MSLRALLLLLLAPFIPVSCTPSMVVPEMTPEERRLLPDHSTLEKGAAQKIIQETQHRIRTFQGTVTARMQTADRSGTFDGALVFQRSRGLRMKGFRGLGATFLDLLLSETGAILFLPGERKAYVATENEPLPMGEGRRTFTTRDMLDILTLGGGEAGASLDLQKTNDAWIGQTPRRRMEFDRRTLFLRQTTVLDDQARPLLTASFREYRRIGDEWFPRLMEMEEANGTFSLALLVKEASLNEDLLPGVFDLVLPDDIERIQASTGQTP